MFKLSFLSIFIGLAMSGVGFGKDGKAAEVKVGDEAPLVELMSSGGEKVSLKDYEGKKMVILAFSRGHWWRFCMAQLVQLRDGYDDLAKAGAEVVVVFREERGGLVGLKKAEKVNAGKFPLLLDDAGAKTKVYSESGYDTYIIGKDGKVAAKLDGVKVRRPNVAQLLEKLKEVSK